MICKDPLPFSLVSGDGVKNFSAKNFPDIHLPAESTLSKNALYDVYCALKGDVKKLLLLADVVEDHGCFCIMFDGWMDRYFGRPYLGLCVAFIHPET